MSGHPPKKKLSGAKIVALIVSIGLHAVLAFYLGRLALDYALPKGEVTSYEMDFIQGDQTATTEVSAVEPTPAPEPVAPSVVSSAPKPSTPKPIAAKPSSTLPTKENTEPIQDHQGDIPVATEIPEDTHKEMIEEEQPSVPQEEPDEIVSAPVAETTPTEAPPVVPAQETAKFGAADGVQSDTVLIPYGSNKGISYPMMGRMRKLEGVTTVHYTVSGAGEVTEVKIVESSGHSILDNQAVDTIKGWKFKPTGQEGVYERPVRFQLTGEAKAAPSQLRRLKTN